ncbi:trigger factor [Leptotrichia sp. oral taxon 218]|jgi:trigger factor|uniref:trigger factor n=1 Tax=Leptotrichia sp. oral taxon 218 TaxID=712361 RepID=UPI001B8CDC72|nr:trigger factor [Leptotrichia sp. oral taxon 218]QUB95988.1 trigger factor [Leptotrichia sp. oral taxon 218]
MAVKKLDETTYEVSAVREGEEFKHLKEHVLVHFKDAKVDGFRPGHVPANVIEKNFKKEIDGEILNHIISDEYQKAVAENELKPIADIKLEKYEIQADKAEVVFTIPVLPSFELGQYKGLEVEKENFEVTDEKVNEEIEGMRKNASKLKEVAEDEEAKNDDVVNINFEGFVDGVAFDGGKAEGYDLTLGSHSFIDTFEDQIVGHKKNDEFDVNVKFPEAYHAENLKGKPALFKVKVNSIKRKEEAELNDDLAKELGFESVDDMRAKTRENITKREEARVENEFKNKIIEKVVDGTNVEAPRALVDREIEFQINRFAQQLQMQGINLSQYFQMTGQTIDKMREDSREMAEKSVKTELVLSEISKVENITVTDEEVDNEFEVMATMYGMDKATMLDEVKKSGNYQRFVDEAKYRLVNQKTIDLLVKETKVK